VSAQPAPAPPAAGVRVERVTTRAQYRAFLRLPWRVYRDDPVWVPPLLAEQRKLLDRHRHPFHRHAEVEYFLAYAGREPIGRIAAIVNRRHNQFHGERCGFFGFFEAATPDAPPPLYAAAEAWLRDRSMELVRGPMNFSTNEESASPGFLLSGFEHRPVILTPHSPPWYGPAAEACGYRPCKDLLAYWLDGAEVPPRLVAAGERMLRREGIRIRSLRLGEFEAEVRRVMDVYNSAWERNWGFVPMTPDELDTMVRELRPIVRPELVAFAEAGGETVGFAVALPDYNRVLARLGGRLLPFGFIRALRERKKISTARVFALGLKPSHRRSGLAELLYLKLFQEGRAAGFTAGECSWILEDNWPMRRGLERMGAYVYRSYRVYEKRL
jgi:GNAT superfamily N-acetyltransferase